MKQHLLTLNLRTQNTNETYEQTLKYTQNIKYFRKFKGVVNRDIAASPILSVLCFSRAQACTVLYINKQTDI